MNTNLNELLNALPQDEAESAPEFPQQELERIFADLAMRRPPATSLHRMWTIGELSVQIALAAGAQTVRGWFVDADERERQQMETNLRIGLKIFHRLGYLRGALMKVGQMVGSLPHIAPTQIVDTLDRLRFDAPPMHYSLIREVVENDQGRSPEEMFQSFEKEAFAAASIGQVHRATLKSGEAVAVKIQYPGIARTIDSDLRSLATLLPPIRYIAGDVAEERFDQIRDMMKQEADYKLEAESLRFARSLFADHDDIVVPSVYPDYSGSRVLTMDYLHGQHVGDFLAGNPSQDLRDAFGAKICFAWFRMHAEKMNYADPHSGNYLFMHDGRLGLIDFGCMQHFSDLDYQSLSQTVRMASGGKPAVREVLLSLGASEAEMADEAFLEVCVEASRFIAEPLRHAGPFDYGDPIHLKRRMKFNTGVLGNKSVIRNGSPFWMYYHRSDLALFALLYRLGARVDMSALPIAEWWGKK